MSTAFIDIPEPYKIKTLLHQKTYLTNGKLVVWEGETAEVYSTISSTPEYNQHY